MTNIKAPRQATRRFSPRQTLSGALAFRPPHLAALHQEAARDSVTYRGRWARDELGWHVPFSQILEASSAPNYRWFTDGEINASFNCRDVPLRA